MLILPIVDMRDGLVNVEPHIQPRLDDHHVRRSWPEDVSTR